MLLDRGLSLTFLSLPSLKFTRNYENFRTNLQQSLSGEPTSLIARDEGISAALEVLRGEDDDDEGEEYNEDGEDQDDQDDNQDDPDGNQDDDDMDDDISGSAADRNESLDDETSQQKTSMHKVDVDDALNILVHNAIKEFGFTPRDVYNGVFDLPRTKRAHDHEVDRLDYPNLKVIVEAFTRDCELLSNHVVAVYPRQSFPADDLWEINFKSPLIARKVVESMRLRESKHLRESYELLHKTPEGSCMAGWFFEAIVHCTLSKVPTPQPTPMASNRSRKGPPVFSTQDPPSRTPTPDTSSSSLVPSRAITVQVDLAHGKLSNVTLNKNRYYVPTTPNHPLFDSFTIDADQLPVVISVFQITISSEHRGSAKGYPSIHKIMARVRELSKSVGRGSDVKIKVKYFLVCPEDGSRYRWRMPDGWKEGPKHYNHRGEAFCIRVPHGMFCPFAPNFMTWLNRDWI